MDACVCGEMEEDELLQLQNIMHLDDDDLARIFFTEILAVGIPADNGWNGADVAAEIENKAAGRAGIFSPAEIVDVPSAAGSEEAAGFPLEMSTAAIFSVGMPAASATPSAGMSSTFPSNGHEVSSTPTMLLSPFEQETPAIIIEEEDKHVQVVEKKHNLTNIQRRAIFQKLSFAAGENDKLPRGIFSETAREFKCGRHTIYRLWNAAMVSKKRGDVVNVDSKLKGKAGRKCKNINRKDLQAVPLKHRTTIISYASFLKVSPSLVYRMIQRGHLRSHTNSVKPKLTDSHKRQRVSWCLRQVIPRTLNTNASFEGFFNYVHMDEKWFYLNKENMRFYLLPNEEEPYRHTQNKKFIPKVMFLAAVGRPLISDTGEVLWDGKIGIFPFTEIVLAQRSSNNRVRGTPEVKAIQRITREVIRQKMIEHVLPCIRAKWPASAQKHIFIQLDNARPHIQPNDHEINAASQVDGFTINLVYQLAQSSDLNILDLGFFRAIQSIQHQEFPKNVEELVKVVEEAYENFPPTLLNYTWLQLQSVMTEILKQKGHNNYKPPHTGKRKLDRVGMLEKNLEVEQDVIDAAVQFMNEESVNFNEEDDPMV